MMSATEEITRPQELIALSNQDRPDELTLLKQQFLASLNHEIRTPLSGILGMADLLLETRLDSDQLEYVNAAKDCAQSLLGILSSALEYAALMSGGTAYLDSEFSVREALDACASDYAQRVTARGLEFHCSTDDDVPEILLGDALRVRQIVSHLLSNALKFTTRGHIAVRCRQEVSTVAGRLIIEVRDTGIGIPRSKLNEIFESFQQVQRGLVRTHSGIGLGLPIALKLAHLMGGDIEVESQPGEGSAFQCVLPLVVPRDTAVLGAPQSAQSGGSRRILLAEDNPLSQKVAAHTLERSGYEIDVVPDGRKALEAAARRAYDLILMDLQMPEMDGLEASAEIRKLPGYSHTPILAFTAASPEECRSICLAHDLQGYLPKPVQQQELVAAVRKHLG